MVIKQEQIPIIWQGIEKWMGMLNISPSTLARVTGYSEAMIRSGCKNKVEHIASYMLPNFVDSFGLRNSRNRSYEDSADILTDEECIELLTSVLIDEPHKNTLWD